MKMLVIIVLLFITTLAFSSEWKDITGTYSVTSKDYLDPPPNQQKNTHYRLQLTGDSAKDLYQAMAGKPVKDECTGGLAKNIQQMQCLYFKNNNTYECHFSINIAEQKIDYGVAC